MQRRIGPVVASLLLALLLVFGLAGTALAHAKLVSSEPAAGARLTSAPAAVKLVFSEEIDANQSSFTVTNAAGATIGSGKLDTSDLDHKTLSGQLKTGLGNGVYTVAWKAVTPDDNGVSEGSFTFGVNADPGAQPTAEHEDEEDATPTPAPTAAGTAPAPTATSSGTPGTLPRTGAGVPDLWPYLLVALLVLLAGSLLRRVERHQR